MSEREVVVADLSRKYDNPIAELVRIACQFKCEFCLKTITGSSMQRVLWESWH